jgi:D-arabinose 1-dehydrogenase-like Zn-dependent alcohol dehydrogenase
VILQDAPTAFNQVVLAVIGRVVSQLQDQLVPVGEINETLHELGAGTRDFRAVVQIDQQPPHIGMGGLAVGPP